MVKKTWEDFERLVFRRLKRKYRGFERIEVQEEREGSRADFVVHNFWILGKIVVEAKHKNRVTREDVDKAVEDGKAHRCDWKHLYISTETALSEEVLEYARKRDVEVYRLAWNGQETRLV